MFVPAEQPLIPAAPEPLSVDTAASSPPDTPACTPALNPPGRQGSKWVPRGSDGWCQRSGICPRSSKPRLSSDGGCSRSTRRYAGDRWHGTAGMQSCSVFASRGALSTEYSPRSRTWVLIHGKLLPALVQNHLGARLWRPCRRLRWPAAGSSVHGPQ